MTAGIAEMPKKKARPSDDWLSKPKKPVAAQLRSTEAYKDWLDRLCKFDHRSISDLIELAIAKHARDVGFPDPPPER